MAKSKSKQRLATAGNRGPRSLPRRGGGKGSVDRHFMSALFGLILGAGAFYAKRSIDTKTAAS